MAILIRFEADYSCRPQSRDFRGVFLYKCKPTQTALYIHMYCPIVCSLVHIIHSCSTLEIAPIIQFNSRKTTLNGSQKSCQACPGPCPFLIHDGLDLQCQL